MISSIVKVLPWLSIAVVVLLPTVPYTNAFCTTRIPSIREGKGVQRIALGASLSAAEEWYEREKQMEALLPDNPMLDMTTNASDTATATAAVNNDSNSIKKKKFVVVGGGWGGWGAAKALCEGMKDSAEVILIDALPDPTGRTPYLSKSGKPVEAGTRGFWKDYPNINELVVNWLGLKEEDVFTEYTNSSFYSPDGLEATAPVFSSSNFPQLPSPFGQVLATFPLFERIPLSDRASMVGLLLATIDCLGGDEKTQMAYDRMTAHDLFIRFGLSDRLVRDFIKPTLLVGLFKPPEELSALVVMELLYYYALAHQDSFDVRWIKNGTVSDSLIAPLATKLQDEYGLTVMGGCRVGQISLHEASGKGGISLASEIHYSQCVNVNNTVSYLPGVVSDVDGVILALGCKGIESVVRTSPQLAILPEFSQAASLKGIDVISVRIWFDRKIETRTPANVFSRFDALRGAGGTFFMLDQFQDDNDNLWGNDYNTKQQQKGSVVACDFYNAGGLISLSNEDILNILTRELLPSAVSAFGNAEVVDFWVEKYPGTVSWFSPGSYTKRPLLEGAGNSVLPNVKFAGDIVRMGEREHGAKGLCQERAYVSGIEAANSLLASTSKSGEFRSHRVIPVRDDEIQFKLGVEMNKKVMQFIPRFWVR